MKKSIVLFFSVLLLSVCTEKDTPETEKATDEDIGIPVYFFSFETDGDTTGWQGTLSPDQFEWRDDAPYGARVLRLSGGCIMPTAYFTDQFQCPSGFYRLGGWLKVAWGSGISVSLNRVSSSYYPDLYISSQDTCWRYCISDTAIWIEQGEPIILELHAGGYVSTGGLFDGIGIYIVEE